jgi:hypothetical protein
LEFTFNLGITFEFPIVSTLEEAIKEAKAKFHSDLNLFTIFSTLKNNLVIPYLPEVFLRHLLHTVTDDLSFLYSNVPFSSEPWHICNKVAHKIGVFGHTQLNWKFFLIVTTYKGEIRLTAIAHENLKMDPQLLLDYCQDMLLEEIEKMSGDDGTSHAKTD